MNGGEHDWMYKVWLFCTAALLVFLAICVCLCGAGVAMLII